MTCLFGTALAGCRTSTNDIARSSLPDTPEGLVILHQQVISETENNTATIIMWVVSWKSSYVRRELG